MTLQREWELTLKTALWRAKIILACFMGGALLFVWLIVGLPLWVSLIVMVLGVLANGALALWEDEQPGGYNNPDLKK